jgi:hypothetical protein
MLETEYRKLREWVRELSPKAIFLLTFIGSAVAAGIVSWIPNATLRTILMGIGLGMNALLIAWLSQVRTGDNEAIIRERTILLQQVKKLQRIKELQRMKELEKAPADTGRQSPQREPPSQRISGLEKSRSEAAGLVSRTDARDLAASPRWSLGEQDAYKQWKMLNGAEKAMVRFVLQRGSATAAQLLQFRDPDGFRTTDTCSAVKQKTSFLSGDLEGGLTINPRLKPYLEKILVEDKTRDARSF